MLTVKNLSIKISKLFLPKKIGLVIAGFGVNHTHIHIIPMHKEDDITSNAYLDKDRVNVTNKELEKILHKII